MSLLSSLKARAKELKQFTLIAYYAARDPRTPTHVRVLALFITAYALSPIDLIPDFIPVLGYLDDLVLVPLGLALVIRLLPPSVMVSARARAQYATERPVSKLAASVIIAIWLLILFLLGRWALSLVRA